MERTGRIDPRMELVRSRPWSGRLLRRDWSASNGIGGACRNPADGGGQSAGRQKVEGPPASPRQTVGDTAPRAGRSPSLDRSAQLARLRYRFDARIGRRAEKPDPFPAWRALQGRASKGRRMMRRIKGPEPPGLVSHPLPSVLRSSTLSAPFPGCGAAALIRIKHLRGFQGILCSGKTLKDRCWQN